MAAAKAPGIPKAGMSNRVRLAAKGKLDGGDVTGKPVKVTPEQMEIARLRAEAARLRMERDIAKKAAAFFAQGALRGTPGYNYEMAVPGERVMRGAGGRRRRLFQLAAPA